MSNVKSRLSNNRGLVQSADSSIKGLQLTPSHENGAGMHFKSIQLNMSGAFTLVNTDNAVMAEITTSLLLF